VRLKATIILWTGLLLAGCATTDRALMPTPSVYQVPGGRPAFDLAAATDQNPSLDLLYITDRAPETSAEGSLPYGDADYCHPGNNQHGKRKARFPLSFIFNHLSGRKWRCLLAPRETMNRSAFPYGKERAKQIFFGAAQIRFVPDLDWETLRAQSQLRERDREINLELGNVRALGAFPEEPYRLARTRDGLILRDRAELARHAEARASLSGEIQRRLAATPKKEILLYVHASTRPSPAPPSQQRSSATSWAGRRCAHSSPGPRLPAAIS
jgi:hypothetical protein